MTTFATILGPALQHHLDALHSQLQRVDLTALARQSGFQQRSSRKVPLPKFLLALVALAAETTLSLERVAAVIALARGGPYSKQAFHERLGVKLELFLAGVATTLFQQLGQPLQQQGCFKTFGRVLLHDSTVQALPQHLAGAFPGARNARRAGAAVKLQFVCDLLQSQVLQVSLSGFTRNDQAASPDIVALAQPNDLIIRDLGYFVIKVLASLCRQGAFFLSRYRHDVLVFDPATGERLDLARRLRPGQVLDRPVLLGTEKLPVRLVACPVPEALANERRRKAKANRDHRLNPSQTKLYLLGWNIFVTNVARAIWPPQTLPAVYRLRWRIEIIFKAWKSHLGLRQLNCRTADLVRLSAMTKLLFCIAAYRFTDALELLGNAGRHVSLLRLARILGQCACWFAASLLGVSLNDWLEWHLRHHLFYEKRTDRKNFYELLQKTAAA